MNLKDLKDLGLDYETAAHGMQSGVAMEMNYRSQPTEPKHLRVGVNSALVDASGLALLLIDKGVIKPEEYVEAIRLAMNNECARYEEHISKLVGSKITLR